MAPSARLAGQGQAQLAAGHDLALAQPSVVERRAVELGVAHDGKRVVKQGLSAGEWIVVNGLQRARPGAPVNPQKVEAKAAAVAKARLGEAIPTEARLGEMRPRVSRGG